MDILQSLQELHFKSRYTYMVPTERRQRGKIKSIIYLKKQVFSRKGENFSLAFVHQV